MWMKTQMTTYCMTAFIRNSRKGKTIVIRPGVAGGGEEKKNHLGYCQGTQCVT